MIELNEIKQGLRTFVQTRFKIADSDPDFNDDVHLFDYGYVDSFGAVELMTFIKETYAVEISNSDLIVHPLNTITEIGSLVSRRLKGEV